jgi:pyruvate dehydrogenase E1 component alpha subunit
LIELLTYRIGAHTTADDPTRYRDPAEVEMWRARDPITRFRRFLMNRELLTAEQDDRLTEEIEAEINQAVSDAESIPAPSPDSIFEYASADLSPRLQEQHADMIRYANERKPGRG